MGSNDQKERIAPNGVRQEIVILAEETTDEFAGEVLEWLSLRHPALSGRLESRWNTWKGRYVTHPDDHPDWTHLEFCMIWSALRLHPDVWGVDYSDDEGSTG